MDDIDIGVNSFDLALDHPDLIQGSEPQGVTETLDDVDEVIAEHPTIIINPTDVYVEPTDLIIEHPRIIAESPNIEVEPNDIVLDHPEITKISTDIRAERDDITVEHDRAAEGPKYINIEPTDIAIEHPKIVKDCLDIEPNYVAIEHPRTLNSNYLDLEPNYVALEHPKLAVQPLDTGVEVDDLILEHPKAINLSKVDVEPSDIALDHPKIAFKNKLDLEPNELVLEHPKIVKKLFPVYVEPNFIVTEHPKVLKDSDDIVIEPTDIAIEHPKVIKEESIDLEPSDIVEEHPDLTSLSTNGFAIRGNHRKTFNSEYNQNHNPSTDITKHFKDVESSEPLNRPFKPELKISNMNENIEADKFSSDTSNSSKQNPFDYMNEMPGATQEELDKLKTARKMAEKQVKQPGMDIDSVEIVPRLMWNAMEPTMKIPLEKPITAVLATYTGTKPCFNDTDCQRIIQNLQISQMEQNNLPDIQWNFMIGGTGKVYEGRGFDTLATKPPHYEKEALDSLDIAYICNNEDEELVPCMFAALNGLTAYAMDNGILTKPFTYLQDSPQYRKVLRLN